MYVYKMPIFVAQQKIPLTSNKPTDMVREYERKQKKRCHAGDLTNAPTML